MHLEPFVGALLLNIFFLMAGIFLGVAIGASERKSKKCQCGGIEWKIIESCDLEKDWIITTYPDHTFSVDGKSKNEELKKRIEEYILLEECQPIAQSEYEELVKYYRCRTDNEDGAYT